MLDLANMDLENPFDVDLASSCLSSISYDPVQMILTCNFVEGQTYEYYFVPLPAVLRLCNAPSVGRFFNAVIRDQYESMEQ
jgi:hypothetical protein